jgi:hypothetical protein
MDQKGGGGGSVELRNTAGKIERNFLQISHCGGSRDCTLLFYVKSFLPCFEILWN